MTDGDDLSEQLFAQSRHSSSECKEREALYRFLYIFSIPPTLNYLTTLIAGRWTQFVSVELCQLFISVISNLCVYLFILFYSFHCREKVRSPKNGGLEWHPEAIFQQRRKNNSLGLHIIIIIFIITIIRT